MGIFSWIKEAVQDVRDSAVETGIRVYLSNILKPFGTMTNLTIDSKARTIHLELELKGETSSIRIEIEKYALHEEGGELFLEILAIRASREWMNLAADQFVKNKRFKIPSYLKAAL